MLIQYLITSIKKNKEEIKTMLDETNICGFILVGNQLMNEDSEYELLSDKYIAKVFNLKGKGVSRNRNFLLKKANADYISFLDDDMYFEHDSQFVIEKIIEKEKLNGIRFNVVSDNSERPIKILKKNGFASFRKLSSYGVCGVFYKREFLLNNNLFFREDVGPGTEINHGEDSLFIRQFLKYSKIYCLAKVAFHAKQAESTWQGKKRDLKLEMFSHGYVYKFLYPNCPKIMANFYVITHRRRFPKGTSRRFILKQMYSGINAAKQLNNDRDFEYKTIDN